jgi:hypothetical protein
LEGGQQQQPALGRTAAAMAAATGAQVHAGCDGALLFCFSGARTQSGGVGLAAALEPTPTASQLAQQQLLGRLPAEAAASLLRTVGPPAGAGALPAAAPAPAKVAPTAVAPAAAMAPVEAKHRLPVQQEVVMVVREASQLAQRTAGLASGFERLLTLAEEGSARRAPQQGAAAPEVTAAVREASQLARRVVQHSAQLELLLQPALPRRVLRPGGHLPAVPARPANARPSRREPAAAAAGQDKSATHSRGAMLPAAQSAAVQPSVPAGASAAPDVTCATLRPSLPGVPLLHAVGCSVINGGSPVDLSFACGWRCREPFLLPCLPTCSCSRVADWREGVRRSMQPGRRLPAPGLASPGCAGGEPRHAGSCHSAALVRGASATL